MTKKEDLEVKKKAQESLKKKKKLKELKSKLLGISKTQPTGGPIGYMYNTSYTGTTNTIGHTHASPGTTTYSWPGPQNWGINTNDLLFPNTTKISHETMKMRIEMAEMLEILASLT
jgi:hypothetical protein